jgi:hypothetical protein
MSSERSRGVNSLFLLLLALLFLTIAGASFYTAEKLFGSIPDVKDRLTLAQLIVSFFGFIGAIMAFSLAIMQYKKGERWKRMEFIAREIKEFESDPMVQNALLMIDWGRRRVNLFVLREPTTSDLVEVTRDLQWKAGCRTRLNNNTRNIKTKQITEIPRRIFAGSMRWRRRLERIHATHVMETEAIATRNGTSTPGLQRLSGAGDFRMRIPFG